VLARVAAAARAGGGVYVAVPSGLVSPDRTRLWRVGAPRATTIATGGGRHYVAAVVPTPDSRLWVAWSEEDQGVSGVVLRRSNPAVTRFGERIAVDGPDSTRIFDLDGSSQALRLDLLASSGTTGSQPFHTQVLPPLELRATPRRFRGGSSRSVRFTVTDVGVPVDGVVVRAAGEQAMTGRDGTARLVLRRRDEGGQITARATKRDYRSDRLTLTVTRVAASDRRSST
jgi:hypothetical protein